MLLVLWQNIWRCRFKVARIHVKKKDSINNEFFFVSYNNEELSNETTRFSKPNRWGRIDIKHS